MSEQKINVGFLGVGALSTKQHVPNVFRSPSLAVHTLCDLDTSRLEFYRQRYQPRKVTTRLQEMLADPEVDLVVIALQPDLQAGFAEEVLRAGKHVFVEKPLATELSPALAVARAARDAGRYAAVGYNRRFAPAYLDVMEAIREDAGPIMIQYRMVDDARDRSAWYASRVRLLDEACHVFDLFNWLACAEPVGIYATSFGREEDHQVVVEYENGVTASLMISSFGAFGWPKERLEVVGDNKVLGVEDFVELQAAGVRGLTEKRYAGREYDGFTHGYAQAYEQVGLPFYRYMRRLMEQRLLDSGLMETARDRDKWEALAEAAPDSIHIPVNYSCDKGWYNSLEHLGQCIRDGRKPGNADAQDATKTIAMGMAAIESIKLRQPVRLDRALWSL